MKKIMIAMSFFLLSTAIRADDGADLVKRGLEAYKKSGATEAVNVWVKNGGLEGSKAVIAQASTFTQIETYYGDFESYEIVKINNISERSQMILYVMHYESGPTYGRFQAYKKLDGTWVATEFKFHTEAVQVWPSETVFGKN